MTQTEEARIVLAECYYAANKNHLLIELLANTKSVRGWYLLSLSHLNLSEYDRAESVLLNSSEKMTKEITPELKGSPQALFLLGQIWERLKWNDDAI